MNKLYVIKIGGNVLDDEASLQSFLKDFAAIQAPKILIHGGGTIATKIGDQLGIESKYVKGRRITDAATLGLVTMVYGGLLNKQLVAQLQQLNCNAMGFTGADGNLIQAIKRPVKDVDYGFVGDITPDSVNSSLLFFLLKQNVIPIFAPLTHADGSLLNTNADTIASVISISLSKHFDVRLIYCFEKKGVLMDINDEESIIRDIDPVRYEELKLKQIIHSGMLPKLDNAFTAISCGVKAVIIGRSDELSHLKNKQPFGTRLSKSI